MCAQSHSISCSSVLVISMQYYVLWIDSLQLNWLLCEQTVKEMLWCKVLQQKEMESRDRTAYLRMGQVCSGLKCVNIDVRVLGITSPSVLLSIFSKTEAKIQQKTGMWHIMWRLLSDSTYNVILLAGVSLQFLFLKSSFFWWSLNPPTGFRFAWLPVICLQKHHVHWVFFPRFTAL